MTIHKNIQALLNHICVQYGLVLWFYVKYVIYLSKIAIIIFFSQHTETIEQLNFVSTLSDTNNSYHFRQI